MIKHISIIFIYFCINSLLVGQRTIIHAGSLIDGKSKKVVKQHSIIIEKGIITSVVKGYAKSKKDDTVINLKDKTVLPGWIDMHVHLNGESNPQAYGEDFYMNPEDVAYRAIPWVEKTLKALQQLETSEER